MSRRSRRKRSSPSHAPLTFRLEQRVMNVAWPAPFRGPLSPPRQNGYREITDKHCHHVITQYVLQYYEPDYSVTVLNIS